MFRCVQVVGTSMRPTLEEGDRLLVSTRAFRRRAPRVGEIVVVEHPREPRRIVKRVAAAPGDLFEGRRLGPDEFAVVGDNPSASTDARAFGSVARSAFVGLVRWRYRPWRRIRPGPARAARAPALVTPDPR